MADDSDSEDSPSGNGPSETDGGRPDGGEEQTTDKTFSLSRLRRRKDDEPRDWTASPPWSSQTKLAIAVGLVIAALWAAYVARNIITLAALAGLIAFLVSPIIRLLHQRLHVPRGLALLGSYILVFLALLFFGALVADGMYGAVSEIDPGEAASSLRDNTVSWLKDIRQVTIFSYTIDLSEVVDPIIKQLDTASTDTSASADGSGTLKLSSDEVQTLLGGVTSSFTTLAGAITAAIMSGIVTVLVAIYLNADSSKFINGIRSWVPESYEDDAERMASEVYRIWRGYIYGQLLNSLITGLLVWFVLWLVGLPGAFMFGLIMAFLNMIPTFGPILAAIPGVLAALALGSDRLDWSNITFALLVVGIYLVVVQLQANLIAPYVTGKAVRLSPATVMLGLIVGVQVAGLVGALLVVPVIATGKALAKYTMAKLNDRDPFADDDETTEGIEVATA